MKIYYLILICTFFANEIVPILTIYVPLDILCIFSCELSSKNRIGHTYSLVANDRNLTSLRTYWIL